MSQQTATHRITLARTVPYGSVALPGDVILARGQSVDVDAETATALKEGLGPAIEAGALPGLTPESVLIEEIDARDASSGTSPGNVDATDGALALAGAEDVDLTDVKGTGADGRITKADVEAYLKDLDEE